VGGDVDGAVTTLTTFVKRKPTAPQAPAALWNAAGFLERSGDFKRAMGVNLIPHVFILDGNKNVVYQHTSYAEGSENELYEIIQKVAAGEEVPAEK